MTAIRLTAERPAIDIDSRDVYFTFASGRFDYDCVACNAQCCRGFGYSLKPGVQLAAQLRSSSSVRFFVNATQAARRQYHVINCQPHCYFLSDAGRCKIQTTEGYDNKPTTCRLFPFNSFRRAGRFLVVAPHPHLCPLRVLPRHASSAVSDHSVLIASMASQGIDVNVPDLASHQAIAEARLPLERQIATLAESHLEDSDYRQFVVAQLLAASGPLGLGKREPVS